MSAWQVLRYEQLDSTNNKALQLPEVGEQRIVIQAEKQTVGRGRRGRSWCSLNGNLFFSQILSFDLRNLGALVIIASLSVLQTIKVFFPQADTALKWPNDVLLNQAKVCGMLLEKGQGDNIIIGIGVNTAQSPKDTDMLYPVISLAEVGYNISCNDFLKKYLQIFDDNLEKWHQDGISQLRQQWEEFAYKLGEKIIVKQDNKQESGVFGGIDDGANLLLQQDDKIKKIIVGDVFYLGK